MNKIVYIVVLLISGVLFSQEKDKNLYNGNQSFAQKSYTNAEADYRVTESKKSPKKAVAGYNLGNSIYRQNQPGEAQINAQAKKSLDSLSSHLKNKSITNLQFIF